MSNEEDMAHNNEPNEQFKYVKQGWSGETLPHDQSGVKTISLLVAAFIIWMGVYSTAQYLRASYAIRSGSLSPESVALVPYFCAIMIFATCVVAGLLLILIIWCVRIWIEADLSPRAIKVILFGFTWLAVLLATTIGSLWWFYSV